LELQGTKWYSIAYYETQIELDITIPPLHQTCYHMNLNHVVVVKQHLDKLLVVKFIESMEHVIWLLSIGGPKEKWKITDLH
jgi:hypothetical protein